MTTEFSLEQLAAEVQRWSEEYEVFPANGQAADAITERTIRYYRTLGLLDPPAGNYTKTFSQKHRLQLIAIRLYQSYGLPLRKIRDELYGKSLEDLMALEKKATRTKEAHFLTSEFSPPTVNESWAVVPLSGDFLLISRTNQQLPKTIIEKVNALITSAVSRQATSVHTHKN